MCASTLSFVGTQTGAFFALAAGFLAAAFFATVFFVAAFFAVAFFTGFFVGLMLVASRALGRSSG
jgi:hypothetical protein